MVANLACSLNGLIVTQRPIVRRSIFHQLESTITRAQHERQYFVYDEWIAKLPVNTRDITRIDRKVASVKISEKHMTLFVWQDFSSA